mgnify:FL=1
MTPDYERDLIFQIYHICKNRPPSKFKKAEIKFNITSTKSTVELLEDLHIYIDEKITIKDLDTGFIRTYDISDIEHNFDPTAFRIAHGRDPFLMDGLPNVLLDILYKDLHKKDKPW